nr:hypothetical protein [Methylobacterium sp. BTF04]
MRSLAIGSVFGSSLLAIGFVCVDRLTHPVPAPIPAMARAAPYDPTATGTLAPLVDPARAAVASAKPAPLKPEAAKPKATDGFDTERLNALMRGDPTVTLARAR